MHWARRNVQPSIVIVCSKNPLACWKRRPLASVYAQAIASEPSCSPEACCKVVLYRSLCWMTGLTVCEEAPYSSCWQMQTTIPAPFKSIWRRLIFTNQQEWELKTMRWIRYDQMFESTVYTVSTQSERTRSESPQQSTIYHPLTLIKWCFGTDITSCFKTRFWSCSTNCPVGRTDMLLRQIVMSMGWNRPSISWGVYALRCIKCFLNKLVAFTTSVMLLSDLNVENERENTTWKLIRKQEKDDRARF